MSKRILLVEDEAGLREWIAEFLRENDFVVEDFFRIDQAKEYFSEHQNEIDCIVVDLQMDDKWLDKHKNESYNCFFTGAVWLEHYVYSVKPHIPTVIYSGFVDLLKKEKSSFLQGRTNIKLIDKLSEEKAIPERLINAINELLYQKGE